MTDRLTGIVARSLDVVPEAVDDSMEFNQTPGWDSLAHMTLMLTLEEEYGIAISDDDVVELTTVAAIKTYIERVTATKGSNTVDA